MCCCCCWVCLVSFVVAFVGFFVVLFFISHLNLLELSCVFWAKHNVLFGTVQTYTIGVNCTLQVFFEPYCRFFLLV